MVRYGEVPQIAPERTQLELEEGEFEPPGIALAVIQMPGVVPPLDVVRVRPVVLGQGDGHRERRQLLSVAVEADSVGRRPHHVGVVDVGLHRRVGVLERGRAGNVAREIEGRAWFPPVDVVGHPVRRPRGVPPKDDAVLLADRALQPVEFRNLAAAVRDPFPVAAGGGEREQQHPEAGGPHIPVSGRIVPV